MFKTLLIANRGEIACRIIRTAAALGIKTIAVYSEVDHQAAHTRMADVAICIGPAPAIKSYLDQETLIRTALEVGAEAIHPGYGFLSENPAFAQGCLDAGLVFIGPPPAVISEMGIKSRAKTIMSEAGIPVIPGYSGDLSDEKVLLGKARGIGFPLLIKADRGGGGKGIRLVESQEEMREALASAAREAGSAFGDSSLLLEKLVRNARHIEVQIFRDSLGNSVHLFERDCSLQRRHQKIVEETPAPHLPEVVRSRLHTTAVRAADAIGYLGAGTVEFLVDAEENSYFLEINTRLQVEHPVTEMVTGQDLVHWQLLVAAGEHLPCSQEELSLKGHAIEARVYAEDPAHDFLPSTGTIHHLQQPEEGVEVRIDSGIQQGDEITPYYDPILAKLIVHGGDRNTAVDILQKSLAQFQLAGIATNLEFLARLTMDSTFLEGRYSAEYLDSHLAELTDISAPGDIVLACAALYIMENNQLLAQQSAQQSSEPYSPWNDGRGFRCNMHNSFKVLLHHQDQEYSIEVIRDENGCEIRLAESRVEVSMVSVIDRNLSCYLDGTKVEVTVVIFDSSLSIFVDGKATTFLLGRDNVESSGDAAADSSLRAPIPGNVAAVFVSENSEVSKGDSLMVLEAMKMEYIIRAPRDGVVKRVIFGQGDAVREGERVVEIIGRRESGDGAS